MTTEPKPAPTTDSKLRKQLEAKSKVLPWERQPGETPTQYRYFIVYRDLHRETTEDGDYPSLPFQERELAEVAELTDKKIGYMHQMSSKQNWRKRGAAYDLHLEKIIREANERSIIDMNKRQAKIGQALQSKALNRLQTMQPEELSAREVKDYLVDGSKIERMARGEATENTQTTNSHTIEGKIEIKKTGMDLSKLTDEELKTLESIMGKLA